jgi:hypothetical protein
VSHELLQFLIASRFSRAYTFEANLVALRGKVTAIYNTHASKGMSREDSASICDRVSVSVAEKMKEADEQQKQRLKAMTAQMQEDMLDAISKDREETLRALSEISGGKPDTATQQQIQEYMSTLQGMSDTMQSMNKNAGTEIRAALEKQTSELNGALEEQNTLLRGLGVDIKDIKTQIADLEQNLQQAVADAIKEEMKVSNGDAAPSRSKCDTYFLSCLPLPSTSIHYRPCTQQF